MVGNLRSAQLTGRNRKLDQHLGKTRLDDNSALTAYSDLTTNINSASTVGTLPTKQRFIANPGRTNKADGRAIGVLAAADHKSPKIWQAPLEP